MSRRFDRMFRALAERLETAVIPFWMLGDPDETASLDAIEALVAAGAPALELGIPFSDPVADGPVVAAAARRALAGGMTPTRCLEMVARLRERHAGLPIGLLVYANLVFARGIDGFHRDAAAAGADSVLVADVPLRESAPFRAAAARHGIAHVPMLPPDASDATTDAVAAAATGHVYVLGRAGVTGADRAAVMPTGRLARLKAAGAPPAVVGFGVSLPAHVRAARAAGAAGVVVGSALLDPLHGRGDATERFLMLLAAARPNGSSALSRTAVGSPPVTG